ncbi:MAG: hypothetical protein EOM65_04895 [Synergistales bacterium]|nr:hypothetical protein [Synergistales bacterium]
MEAEIEKYIRENLTERNVEELKRMDGKYALPATDICKEFLEDIYSTGARMLTLGSRFMEGLDDIYEGMLARTLSKEYGYTDDIIQMGMHDLDFSMDVREPVADEAKRFEGAMREYADFDSMSPSGQELFLGLCPTDFLTGKELEAEDAGSPAPDEGSYDDIAQARMDAFLGERLSWMPVVLHPSDAAATKEFAKLTVGMYLRTLTKGTPVKTECGGDDIVRQPYLVLGTTVETLSWLDTYRGSKTMYPVYRIDIPAEPGSVIHRTAAYRKDAEDVMLKELGELRGVNMVMERSQR